MKGTVNGPVSAAAAASLLAPLDLCGHQMKATALASCRHVVSIGSMVSYFIEKAN